MGPLERSFWIGAAACLSLEGKRITCICWWEIHPALNISTLINNLKTASSRRIRNRFAEHLKPFYQKPHFWHRAYYVGSVGGATLETVQRYVEAQGTTEKAGRRKTKPPD